MNVGLLHLLRSPYGRYCCKTLFALLIKNSPGYRRDFRVKMWGTSPPDDKLVSDLAKAAEATKIGARRLDRLMAGKLSPRNFGLLQQYRHKADLTALTAGCPLFTTKRTHDGEQDKVSFVPLPDLSRCSKLSTLIRSARPRERARLPAAPGRVPWQS